MFAVLHLQAVSSAAAVHPGCLGCRTAGPSRLLSQPGAGRQEDAALAAPEVRLTTGSPHQWSQFPLQGPSFCFLALDLSSFQLLWFSSFFALPPHPHFLGKEKKVSGIVSLFCFKITACQFHVELLISVLKGKVSLFFFFLI